LRSGEVLRNVNREAGLACTSAASKFDEVGAVCANARPIGKTMLANVRFISRTSFKVTQGIYSQRNTAIREFAGVFSDFFEQNGGMRRLSFTSR
jgi:hypothetical protein